MNKNDINSFRNDKKYLFENKKLIFRNNKNNLFESDKNLYKILSHCLEIIKIVYLILIKKPYLRIIIIIIYLEIIEIGYLIIHYF